MMVNNSTIKSMPMRMHNQNNVPSVEASRDYGPFKAKNNGNLRDVVELSMSGKYRSQKFTVMTGKRATAGLLIKSISVPVDFGLGGSETTNKETVTVSNDRAALGASENRLGGNTRSIDNPEESIDFREVKDFVDEIRLDMLEEPINTGLAQGNSNSNSVLYLLR